MVADSFVLFSFDSRSWLSRKHPQKSNCGEIYDTYIGYP